MDCFWPLKGLNRHSHETFKNASRQLGRFLKKRPGSFKNFYQDTANDCNFTKSDRYRLIMSF